MTKMLFTSNYARFGKDPRAFAISVRPPPWYVGSYLRELAPTWDIVIAYKAGILTEREYTGAYLEILKSRNINVTNLVKNIPNNSILLCYEKSTDFCHRHIAAAWLMMHSNVIIQEIADNQQPEQMLMTKELLTF